MLKWKFILFFLFLNFYGNAQGYLEEEDLVFFETIRKDTTSIYITRGHSDEFECPSSYSLLPPEGFKTFDQGDYPLCVPYSFAAAYGIRDYWKSLLYRELHFFSASYMAIKTRACNQGLSFSSAIEFGIENGFCPLELCPNHPCEQEVSQIIALRARKNIIGEDTWIWYTKNKIKADVYTSIKRNLSRNMPIIISTKLQKNFRSLKGVEYWIPNGDYEKKDKHAMVIVGYDDNENMYSLLNSYGESWGKDGIIKIKYDDFWSVLHHAISIEPK